MKLYLAEKREEFVFLLYSDEYSVKDIADIFNVTIKVISEIGKKREEDRAVVYNEYNKALRDGSLVRQPCEVCGTKEVHGHHSDYSKPLDVIWLCSKHHGEEHTRINKQKNEGGTT